jgi:DUF438 domain-containing protein
MEAVNEKNIEKESLSEGHPINIYFAEKEMIQQLIQELAETNPKTEYQKFYNIFNNLNAIEKRFQRKENQFFPYLEKRGWNNPSQGMWSFHDNLRDQFKLLRGNIEFKDWERIEADTENLIAGLNRLLTVEETVLFPNAMTLLTEEDWIQMRTGEVEIGWMHTLNPPAFPEEEYIHPSQDFTKRELSFSLTNTSHYDEGHMTVEQVNLLFKTLPLDLTYVDENDKVIFYNRGEERLFPRSSGIIGRDVRFCHPPKSVGTVLQILAEFRKGTKSDAAFWINYKERLIYIRYFAVRDVDKAYRGVIEMSQDITDIKTIEGQRRLLDWD